MARALGKLVLVVGFLLTYNTKSFASGGYIVGGAGLLAKSWCLSGVGHSVVTLLGCA